MPTTLERIAERESRFAVSRVVNTNDRVAPTPHDVRPLSRGLDPAAGVPLIDLIDEPSASGRRVIVPEETVVRASCGAGRATRKEGT